jgi:hypothetical protein
MSRVEAADDSVNGKKREERLQVGADGAEVE